MPMATCYLYEAGTETLAGGIEDINGNPLANPFGVGASALIQLAAPDGIYDLRVVKGSRDYRLRVQFGDIPAAIQQVEAIAADAAGSAAAASESAASAADAAESKVAVLRSDLANATDPAKGAGIVGWKRSPLASAIRSVGKMLDSAPINLWEFAEHAVGYSPGGNPDEWDWTPALAALAAATTDYTTVVVPPGTYNLNGDAAQIKIHGSFIGYGATFIVTGTIASGDELLFFTRESAGETLDANAWGAVVEGARSISGLQKTSGTLMIESTEPVIWSYAAGGRNYYKNDALRIHLDGVSPQIDRTYNSNATITAKWYPEVPATVVSGFRLFRVSGLRTPVQFSRTGITTKDIYIDGGGIDIDAMKYVDCVDVIEHGVHVVNVPDVSAYGKLIYRVGAFESYGSSADGYHGVGARHGTHIRFFGGRYTQIDSHWGCDWKITGATMCRPVLYCGRDIEVSNNEFIESVGVFTMRADSPEVAGVLRVKDNTVMARPANDFSAVRLFGVADLSVQPRNLRQMDVYEHTGTTVKFPSGYANTVRDTWIINGIGTGRTTKTSWRIADNYYGDKVCTVIEGFIKNSAQTFDGTPYLEIGDIRANPASFSVEQNDTDITWGWKIFVNGARSRVSFRVDPQIYNELTFSDSIVSTIVPKDGSNVDVANNAPYITMNNCELRTINARFVPKIAYFGCVFTGTPVYLADDMIAAVIGSVIASGGSKGTATVSFANYANGAVFSQ